MSRLNRFATLAILPLMAIAIVFGTRMAGRGAKAPMPSDGLLAVGQLRGETLTLFDLRTGARKELALPGPPHEFAAANGRLYVTLGRGNALAEVEPVAPGILRLLHIDGEPHGIVARANALEVTRDRANDVATIDLATFTQIAATPTGDTPHAIAIANGQRFVTDSRDNRLHNLEGELVADTGALPESVAVVGELVVTADADSGTLSVFRADSLERLRQVPVGGHPVRVVTIDGMHVAVALNEGSAVTVVNVDTGTIDRHIPTLGHPDGICLSPDGAYVAIVSNEAGRVQIFRRSDWALAGTLDAGNGPGSCAWLPRH